ncbi:MAG: hypothetical protein K9K65_01170 [Desulfarculaceae bacterium]|nr:hypothetical protein [Desulfarculaceae bacterium]MCF8048683.1 hypothetical protein [Desulfarculaceae bacterium]MCF8096426.1 hypothetical protein [Desulfarculaceae bacterium]MCF8121895.1 hypothetical protein [Desulfarculaceae bacterium]
MAVPLTVRAIFAACLILGLAWAVGIGCGSEQKPVSKKAAEFRTRALSLLVNAKKRLGPLASQDKQDQLRQAMRDLYKDSVANNQALPCGVGILGDNGKALMAAFPDPKAKGGLMVVDGGKDYSQYDKVKQAINSRGNAHFTLYTSDGAVYMICSPLNENRRTGAICLAFFEVTLRDELGVSDEDFASLNFN